MTCQGSGWYARIILQDERGLVSHCEFCGTELVLEPELRFPPHDRKEDDAEDLPVRSSEAA
jgi:hypothetical protein